MLLRIMIKILYFFTLSIVLIGQAKASQCQAIKGVDALKVEKLLNEFKANNPIAVIDRYCLSCRDQYVKPIVIDQIEIKDFQVRGYKEIYVNQKKIDLAYIYLNGENLAEKIGCKVKGILSSL